MSGPVRVALIGCGRISGTHFDAIRNLDGVELAAVCDVVEQRAREAGEQNDVPWFTSYPKMLADARAGLRVRVRLGFRRDGGLMAKFFFVQDPDGYKIEVLQRHGRYR